MTDINEAHKILTENIAAKQKALDATQLALDILTNTFQAEFSARDSALDLFNKARQGHQEEKTVWDAEKANLTSEIEDLQKRLTPLEKEAMPIISEEVVAV